MKTSLEFQKAGTHTFSNEKKSKFFFFLQTEKRNFMFESHGKKEISHLGYFPHFFGISSYIHHVTKK